MERRFSPLSRSMAIAMLVMLMAAGLLSPGAASAQSGIGKATKTPASSTGGGDDASTFAAYLDQETKAAVLYGPKSGSLPNDPDKVTTAESGVSAGNFIAHAAFANPYKPATAAGFDFGFLFRLRGSDPRMRLEVTSGGKWYLAPGANDAIDSGAVAGLDLSADGSNSVDLVVVDGTGYFGVNGTFVARLDLPASSDSADVAIGAAFSPANSQTGASTGYSEFTVWSVKAAATNGDATPSATKTAKTATPAASPSAGGADYVSPTYGYALPLGRDWTIQDQTSDANGDYVRVTNGVTTVDLSGFNTADTPDQCVQSEFDYFTTATGYSSVQVAKDTSGQAEKGSSTGDAWEVVTFTYKGSDGTTTDFTSYIECFALETGTSMLKIDQFTASDKYASESQAVTDLLSGINFSPANGGPASATPTSEATADVTPTTGSSGNAATKIAFSLVDDGGDAIALARLTPNAKDASKTDVRVVGGDLASDAIVVIHKGTCSSFDARAAYILNDFDSEGASTTTVNASLAKLSGGYVVVIQTLDDLATASGCGAIAS